MNTLESKSLICESKFTTKKKILILNLMPDKITTEKQFIKVLQPKKNKLDITWLAIENKVFKNTSNEYIKNNYTFFSKIKQNKYDGLIITGAPVEQIEFEDVEYYDQLIKILDWSKTNVTSSMFICWGSQIALKHFYNIEKETFDTKLHGVFKHQCINHPLLSNLKTELFVPHSRYSQSNQKQIIENKNLTILSSSKDANIHICESKKHNQVFVSGHMEYDYNTLEIEYNNAIARGEKPAIPCNYYQNNIISTRNIIDSWSDNALVFFKNWLKYYVVTDNKITLSA
ncbi:homoserine O-succinyltransferase [Mycoplasma sp. P36-A1]|uniref:homoserine O-succinyltransferase n=1 Tax=Mycoplasma sp. P36-A1 TaxID=3252900 RepID=UPI003C306494